MALKDVEDPFYVSAFFRTDIYSAACAACAKAETTRLARGPIEGTKKIACTPKALSIFSKELLIRVETPLFISSRYSAIRAFHGEVLRSMIAEQFNCGLARLPD